MTQKTVKTKLTQKCNNTPVNHDLIFSLRVGIKFHAINIMILTNQLPDEEIKCLAIELDAVISARFKREI